MNPLKVYNGSGARVRQQRKPPFDCLITTTSANRYIAAAPDNDCQRQQRPNSRHPLSVRCSAEAVKRNDSDSYQLKIASLFRGYLNFDLVNTALRVVECQLMCRYLTLYLSLDADGVERHIRWHCLRRVINGLYLETTQCRLEIDTYGGTVHGKRQIS